MGFTAVFDWDIGVNLGRVVDVNVIDSELFQGIGESSHRLAAGHQPEPLAAAAALGPNLTLMSALGRVSLQRLGDAASDWAPMP